MLRDRLPIARRDAVCAAAAEGASLIWLGDFARRCRKQYEPKEKRGSFSEPMVSPGAADQLVKMAAQRFRDAAAAGELLASPNLVSTLFLWRYLEGDDGETRVRGFSESQLTMPNFVARLARDAVGSVTSQSEGSYAGVRRPQLDRTNVESFVDPDRFLALVEELRKDPTRPSPTPREATLTC